MRDFDELFDISANRKGGAEALEAMLDKPKSAADLAKIPPDRWLSQFTRSIFQAGFSWSVIENKWDGFEAAFDNFDLGACAFMDDEKFDTLLGDTRIIRNGKKIATVRENASFLLGFEDQGGASQVIANWPATEFADLLDLIKTKGSHLGGTSGQYALRRMGKDSFILSKDVLARLVAEGVIDKPTTSKTNMRTIQSAFNTWMDQSGRSLSEISRVLALSL